MKSILLTTFAVLSFATARAEEAPVEKGHFYDLWRTLDTGLAAVSPGNNQSHFYVQVHAIRGDWAKVSLFPNERVALTAMLAEEVKQDSEIGKKFLAEKHVSKEEVAKATADELRGLENANLWIRLSQISAIKEMSLDPLPGREQTGQNPAEKSER